MAKKGKAAGPATVESKAQPAVRIVPHPQDAEAVVDNDSGARESGYAQWLSSVQTQLDTVQPGRVLRVDLRLDALPPQSTSPAAPVAPATPRYTVTIVDHDLARASQQPALALASSPPPLSCGVLILSQGREHDWLFAHAEGQQSLCRQHSFHRLLLVALNRGHSFSSLQQVQDEVRQAVSSLLPARERRGAVPFLALSADIGGRREVAVLPTDANGQVVVEDVREQDGQWIRRLLFVGIGMVQSEARLLTVKGSKGRSHTATPPPLTSPIDFAYLPSGYHQSFLAALSLLPSPPSSILLVGVGAGSLAMFLSCVLPSCALTLVELDGAILRAAEAYFGFAPSERTTVRVMDGIAYIRDTAAQSSQQFDVVCVDCNSGDLSEGLTFPPPAFLQPATLSATHALCRPSSLYLLNFGCRSAVKRKSVVLSLLQHWDELYEVDVGEADISNTVLAARRVDSAAPESAAPVSVSACRSRAISRQRVAEWREQAALRGEKPRQFAWDEQMDIAERCSGMQRIDRRRVAAHPGGDTHEGKEGEAGQATDESDAAQWDVHNQLLPPGEGEAGSENDLLAGVAVDEQLDGMEPSAAERRRAKARAKRARQKASKANNQ